MSTPSRVNISSLPDEVLAAVFSALVPPEKNRSRKVSRCMLVCRRWRGIAEPTAYSILEFSGLDLKRFTQFARTFHHAMIQGRNLMRYVKFFTINRGQNEQMPVSAQSNLVAMLMQAKNLQALHTMADDTFNLITLAITSQTCAFSLQVLEITLAPDCISPALAHLRHFINLRTLVFFTSSGHVSSTVDPVDEGLYWEMPYLHTLELDGEEISLEMATLLRQSHFPTLREITVGFLIQTLPMAHALADFFATLSLDDMMYDCMIEQCQNIILPRISAASFHTGPECLHTTFCDYISPSVRQLYISGPYKFIDLWPILDHVLRAHGRTNIRDIFMEDWDGVLTWVDPEHVDGEMAAVMQRLTRYAVLLGDKGINFRDTEGKTIADYFSR